MKKYMVGRLDGRDIIVHLYHEDTLVAIDTSRPHIADFVRSHDYDITREEYLELSRA